MTTVPPLPEPKATGVLPSGAYGAYTADQMRAYGAACAAAAVAQEREEIIDLVAFHGGSVEIEAAIRARGEAP